MSKKGFFRGKISVYTKRTSYCIRIITVVKNDRDADYVTVYSTARNMRRGRSFTHNRAIWIEKGQTKQVEVVFNEVGFFSPKDRWKCWSRIEMGGKS